MAKSARATRAIDLGTAPVIKLSKRIALSMNGLVVDGRASPTEWEHAAALLHTAHRADAFALGDFLRIGEEQLGDRLYQIVDYGSGWSEETCRNYRWIAEKVPARVRRMDRLTIRHHQVVAPLEVGQQEHWLDLAADAEDGPWTVQQLRDALAGTTDAPPPRYYLLIEFGTQAEQAAVAAQFEGKGHKVKQITSRRRKAKEKEAA